ncbi:ICMT-domain-containing protein [Coprinopsis marcescibilis]|uniref:Protein-S-isoprenylcysteine O-methyltransferase n=1 Tax=Coprinopsis marcescibilis TaxID=230819 RepID=A0A5C3KUM0_COPMA|nr:ICMT-domain-containing protein [Coprinopsis marcescibilis]
MEASTSYIRPIIKTSLLLLSAVSVHLSLSPPNPPVKEDESMVWMGVLTEIMGPALSSVWKRHLSVLSSSQSTPSPLSSSIKHPFQGTSPRDLNACHPLLLAGAMLTLLAASLRIWCFKKLGPMFTFEITIRPKHQLVTSGPYSWVRHPSYTGVYLTLVGATLLLSAPNTWLSASRVLYTAPGCVFAALWAMKCMLAFRGTYLRLTTEDQVLRETFGVEWEEYATRVPWRLVPGFF